MRAKEVERTARAERADRAAEPERAAGAARAVRAEGPERTEGAERAETENIVTVISCRGNIQTLKPKEIGANIIRTVLAIKSRRRSIRYYMQETPISTRTGRHVARIVRNRMIHKVTPDQRSRRSYDRRP